MTFTETLRFLYEQLPMYQRVGNAAFKKGLGNTIALLRALNDPHQAYPCIHIAGTNGKGTVAHLIAAAYQAEGLKVGLYTSPHYVDFRERFKINGHMIEEQFVVDFVNRIRPVIDDVRPSFFEITVALAFEAFRASEVDVAVIETGLGGRLDSTNVITPKISVITNISFDHMEMLGDTLPLIAEEKAGIIKTTVPVVIGEGNVEYNAVFEKHARDKSCVLSYADVEVDCAQVGEDRFLLKPAGTKDAGLQIRIPNPSPFMSQNLRTAYWSLVVLSKVMSEFVLSDDVIARGFQNVVDLTAYKGRWQLLDQQPLTIADSGHNEAGLNITMQRLQKMKGEGNLHMVIGFVREKNIGPILELFPKDAKYYFCRPQVPRGMPVEDLVKAAADASLEGEVFDSVTKALDAAKANAAVTDIIFIGGSTFVVAEIV